VEDICFNLKHTHTVHVTAHHVIKSFVMSVCPIMQRLGTAILTALYRSDTQPCGYNTLFSLVSPRPEHCQYYDRREKPGATSGDHSNINHTINTAVFRDVPSCILVDGHQCLRIQCLHLQGIKVSQTWGKPVACMYDRTGSVHIGQWLSTSALRHTSVPPDFASVPRDFE